tara:strand:- start:216 stop:350 length:135 start_codon:yes stop_codon:yes gene_type:complete
VKKFIIRVTTFILLGTRLRGFGLREKIVERLLIIHHYFILGEIK